MRANKISGPLPISRRRAAPSRVALNPSTPHRAIEFSVMKNVDKAEGAHRCNLGVRDSDLGVPALIPGVRINTGVSIEASRVSILFTRVCISLELEYQFPPLR